MDGSLDCHRRRLCRAKDVRGRLHVATSISRPEASDKDAMKSIELVLTSTEIDLSQHVGHTVSVTGVHAVHWVTARTGTTNSKKPVSNGAVKDNERDDGNVRCQVVEDGCHVLLATSGIGRAAAVAAGNPHQIRAFTVSWMGLADV